MKSTGPLVGYSGWAVRAIMVSALYVGLFLGVFRQMVGQWWDNPNYSHGFLVPLVSGYLIWERRGSWQNLHLVPSLRGAVVLIGGLCVLVLGTLGVEHFLQNVSTVVVLVGLVWLLMGDRFVSAWAFPLGFLFFYVPLPTIVLGAIAFPLQLLAARAAAETLSVCEVPVLREGNIIHLAGTTLEVAEACSGIRSLQALVALGTVYAYFAHRMWWERTALVLLSIPTAVIANALRVSGTGLIAHYFGIEAAEGFYHTFAGWLVFVVAFGLLALCSFGLRRLPAFVARICALPSNPRALL